MAKKLEFFHYSLRETLHPDDCFSRNLQFFFLELPRLGKIWDSLETNLERWCYLFGNLNFFAEKPTDPAGRVLWQGYEHKKGRFCARKPQNWRYAHEYPTSLCA